jgi:hypothetical protein
MTPQAEEALRRQQQAQSGQAVPQPGQHSTDPNDPTYRDYNDQEVLRRNREAAAAQAVVSERASHSETIPDPPTQHPGLQSGPYPNTDQARMQQQGGVRDPRYPATNTAARGGMSRMDYDALHTMLLVREMLSKPKAPGYSLTPSLLASITRDLDALEAKTKVDVEAAQKADAEAAAKAAADEVKARADAAEAKAKVDADAAAAKAKIDAEAARANETPEQKKTREDAEAAKAKSDAEAAKAAPTPAPHP